MRQYINTSSVWKCTVLVILDVVTLIVQVVGILILLSLRPFGGGAWL